MKKNELNYPVLVVDDDPENLKFIGSLLETEGLAPVCCLNRKEALAACKKQDFAVAVLDLELGADNGIELFKAIKKIVLGIKAIIYTGHSSAKSAIDAVNVEIFAYVQKTEDPSVLLAHVHRAFHEHDQQELRLHGEITANMSEGVYLVRADNGIIVYANPKFEEMFGYGQGEIVGKHVSIVNAPADKDPQETAKEIMGIIKSTGEWRGEINNKKKDGTLFWCYASVTLFEHKEYGKVFVSIHTDITEKRKAEESISRQSRYSQLRAEIWKLAADKSINEEELIQKLLNKIGPAIGVSRACYNKFTEEDKCNSDSITVVEWCAEGVKPTLGAKTPKSITKHLVSEEPSIITYETVLEKIPKGFRGIAKPVISQIIKSQNLYAVWMFPYLVDKKVEGLLAFDICPEIKDKVVLTDGIKNVISETVSIVSNYIVRKRAQDALEVSAKQYRNLFDNVEIGLYQSDLKTSKLLSVNKELADIYGATVEEMMKDPGIVRWAHPEKRKEMVRLITEKEHIKDYEVDVLTKNGGRKTILTSINLHKDKGYIEGSVIDITARKKAEIQAANLAKFPDENTNPVARISKDGVLMYANAACMKEVIKDGATVGEKIPEKYAEHIKEIYKSGKKREEELEIDKKVFLFERIPVAESGYVNVYAKDVTVRKKAQEALKKSEQDFRKLFEESNDAVFIHDTKGRLIDVNKKACNMLGYVIKDDLLKISLKDIHPEEELPVVGKAVKSTMQKGHCRLETKFKRSDGGIIDVEVSASVIDMEKGIIQGIARDMSERRNAEKEIENERNYNRDILNTAQVIILVLDTQGRILYYNPYMEDLSGYGIDEMKGKDWFSSFLPGEDNDKIRNLFIKAVDNIQTKGNVNPINTKHRGMRQIQWSDKTLKDADGNTTGLLAVGHDITDQKRAEEEIIKSQKMESIGLLAGGIAHDFNNVLTHIMGNIGFARQLDKENAEVVDTLRAAERGILQAQHLTQQLLEFAKTGTPMKRAAQVKDLLEENVKFVLKGTKCKAGLSFEDDLWLINVDSSQIVQVIDNIVINACYAMPDGGKIEVSAENITFDESPGAYLKSGEYVMIKIADHGCGISQENISKIFDPYFTTKKTGSGLGLSTSYSIIKKHDGHIDVYSHKGQGTVFSIFLPRFSAVLEKGQVKEEKMYFGSGRILVMDDDQDILKAASRILQRLGYEVLTAADGAEAIEKYSSANESAQPFDLVMLDLTVPDGMGGRQAIAKLLELNTEVKAIASSGYSNDDTIKNHKKYGFKGFLTKPYTAEKLSKIVKNVLDKK